MMFSDRPDDNARPHRTALGLRAGARRAGPGAFTSPLALASVVGGLLVLGGVGCSAPPGAELDDDSDGPPDFSGVVPGSGGAPGVGTPSEPSAPPVNGAPQTGSNGEQNPATNAPIAGMNPSGDVGTSNGAGGAAMVPPVGAGGSSVGVAGASGMPPAGETPPGQEPGQPVGQPPVAPNNPSPDQIASFFAQLPCGAKYTALGDGGWQFCLRLADGGAACASGSAEFTRVTFAGGAAVTNVAQVSGQRDSGVAVVTTDGALHVGGVTSISTTPMISSGVVNYSGGYNASVALVEQGAGFGVLSWTGNGTPAPVTLPGGAQPIQVSANYGLACALSTAGDAYCWNAGGNHSLQLTDAPTLMPLARPVQMISVGQNSVCGVSFDNTLECHAAWYDSPFLPTEGTAPNFQLRQSTFPSVREVHVGYKQGIVVRTDGTAAFLGESGQPPADNPGQPFTGVSNIIASGGDRGSACVQTNAGAVFCRVGTGVVQATVGGAPLVAQAAACPL